MADVDTALARTRDTDATAQPVCESRFHSNERREPQSESGYVLLRLGNDSRSGVWVGYGRVFDDI
jgi:hypothetical protein